MATRLIREIQTVQRHSDCALRNQGSVLSCRKLSIKDHRFHQDVKCNEDSTLLENRPLLIPNFAANCCKVWRLRSCGRCKLCPRSQARSRWRRVALGKASNSIKQLQIATGCYRLDSTALSWGRNDQKQVRNRLRWLRKAWTQGPGFQNPQTIQTYPPKRKSIWSNDQTIKLWNRAAKATGSLAPWAPATVLPDRVKNVEWDSDLTRPHRESYGYRLQIGRSHLEAHPCLAPSVLGRKKPSKHEEFNTRLTRAQLGFDLALWDGQAARKHSWLQYLAASESVKLHLNTTNVQMSTTNVQMSSDYTKIHRNSSKYGGLVAKKGNDNR